jgi:hypothetical protein
MAIFRGGEERRIAGLGETCHFAHLQFSVLREMEADRRALLRKWSISAEKCLRAVSKHVCMKLPVKVE